jgi:hypothetical protein
MTLSKINNFIEHGIIGIIGLNYVCKYTGCT